MHRYGRCLVVLYYLYSDCVSFQRQHVIFPRRRPVDEISIPTPTLIQLSAVTYQSEHLYV